MSLDRTQVEAVLLKYNIVDTTGKPTGSPVYVTSPREMVDRYGLIDELCALRPAPSREALWAILRTRDMYVGHEKLVEELMAWATGQPQRVWCPHYRWEPHPNTATGLGQWVSTEDPRWVANVHFKFCPLCGTEKPPDART